jgi:hypothetical protein
MIIETKILEATTVFVDGVVAAFRAHMHELIDETLSDASVGAGPAHTARRAPAKEAATTRLPKSAKAGRASGGERLARRTPEQIAEAVAQVVAVLSKASDGLRAEQIREATDLSTKELPRILKAGVADGAFNVLSGQKRSTTYGLKGTKATKVVAGGKKVKKTVKPAKAAKKAPKKTVKKTAKKVRVKKAAKPVVETSVDAAAAE